MNREGNIPESIKMNKEQQTGWHEDKTTWNQLMGLFPATPFLSIVQISNHEAPDQGR